MDAIIQLMSAYKAGLLVGSLALLWFLEHWLAFYEDQAEGKLKHDSRNMALSLINFAAVSLAFAGVARLASDWALDRHFGLLYWAEAPLWARVAGAVLLLDLWVYFWHRGNHASAFLWRFHRVHHSDPKMDASTGVRFHVGEVALSALVRASFIPLFGLQLWEVVLYEAVVTPLILLHHSNVDLGRLDRWMRLVFVSPNMHRVHHSDFQPETDSNFGVLLSGWDRLFGTYNGREDVKGIRLGLAGTDSERWQSVPGLLATPFRGRPRP